MKPVFIDVVIQQIVFIFAASVADIEGDDQISAFFQELIGFPEGDERLISFCDRLLDRKSVV